jgi:hypothetical protein
MHPRLLRLVKPIDEEVKINGVGSLQLKIREAGYLKDFFTVYASTETRANVLSFAEVEDLYSITYVPQTSFTIHLPNRDIEFVRKGKLYVADFAQHYQVHATTVATKAEEARAKRAYELLRNCGFPSVQEAVRLLETGNIVNMPALVAADFERAINLYGPPVEYVRGKTVKRAVSRAVVDDHLVHTRTEAPSNVY